MPRRTRKRPPGSTLARIPARASFASTAAAASRTTFDLLSPSRFARCHTAVTMIFVTRVPLPPVSASAALLIPLFSACWFAGCASSLGPGYVVEQQKIEVSFTPRPQPLLQITAEYRLQNTGNQPLDSLDVRMP